MKNFTMRNIAMIVVQPFAMYLFLRILECGFFMSAMLAALVALLTGFVVSLMQSRPKV